MKTLFSIVVLSISFSISSCDSFSPGTLGSVAEIDLNCSSIDVERRVDVLLKINSFEIKAKDTANVNWWKDNSYDFLTYRCINIRKRLYMITIDAENSSESTIGVRAYFDRNKKNWIVAKEFNPLDNYRAEKAMEYLSNEMSTCL